MTKIKGILFDCDGVLLDTDTPYRLLVSQTLTNLFDYKISHQEAIDRWKGRNPVQICAELKDEGCNFADEFLAKVTELNEKTKASQESVIYHVKELLEELKDYPKGVCSNGRTVRLHNNFNDVNLFDKFDFIYGRDKLNTMKPDPQFYINGAERLGIDIKNCLIIEDSKTGLQAAIQSGATTVGFTGSGTKTEELARLNPNYIVNDLLEIPKIINKLNQQ